jgi:hypothetical protein
MRWQETGRAADLESSSSVGEQPEEPMPSRIATKTYGTVSPDRQKEITGLEFVQGLVDGTLPLNTIAQTLGYDIIARWEMGASSSPPNRTTAP